MTKTADLKISQGYDGPPNGFVGDSNASDTMPVKQPQAESLCTSPTDIHSARLRALDIIRKFHVDGAASSVHAIDSGSDYYDSSEVANIENGGNNGNPIIQQMVQTLKPPSTTSMSATTSPSEFGRRRRECLDRYEERMKRAMFKNLQYVVKKEEERLRERLDKVEEFKTFEHQIEERYNQRLESRQRRSSNHNSMNDINTSAAGIGTKQRNRAEKKRKRNALPVSLRYNGQKQNNLSNDLSSSIAIYVSNLPKDGSADENVIKSLFGSYGSIRKVHFYLDKATGEKKGDALVIYSLKKGQDESSLTESVCSQVCTKLEQQLELIGRCMITQKFGNDKWETKEEKSEEDRHIVTFVFLTNVATVLLMTK